MKLFAIIAHIVFTIVLLCFSAGIFPQLRRAQQVARDAIQCAEAWKAEAQEFKRLALEAQATSRESQAIARECIEIAKSRQ